MTDPMQEIMASFFVECEDLLEALLDAVQLMDDAPVDMETINVAFRSVHSIKGGAAAFGLDDLVAFAHQFETVMDRCRDGHLVIDATLNAVFFRCSDMLSDLVRCARDSEAVDDGAREGLIKDLAGYVAPLDEARIDEPIVFKPVMLDLNDFETTTAADPIGDAIDRSGPDTAQGLIVCFEPFPELYESGNEPLFLLQSLCDLGQVRTIHEFTPPDDIADLNVIGNRLTWCIEIQTDADVSAAHRSFEFADGLCRLKVRQGTLGKTGSAEKPTKKVPSASGLDASAINQDLAVKPALVVKNAPEVQKPCATNSPSPKTKAAPTLRVDLEHIEKLVNLVGELVINQSMIAQSIAQEKISPNSSIFSGLDAFMQLTRDIQESVMMIRAQPVKSLFQRMSRIVREASAAVGKDVRLITEGENTEIDKTALEKLIDPLTHMIRNAVDHGLEDGKTRLANGKSETGNIRLTAAQKSGRVLIEISDDGGGINRESVRKKAVEKGLIAETTNLSDAEIDQLIFLPGFSTAPKVSNLSGRGVGMDVVKTQISALGGRIAIDSVSGVGSTFSISLPLTLAVLDGMVISVENEALVVPINVIVESLSLKKEDFRRVGPSQTVIRVRDKFVPVLDLGSTLGYRPPSEFTQGTIALLVSPEEGQLIALLIDRIEDQRQVVIKGLHSSYGRVPGVAAATILGDGQIALILDPAELHRTLPTLEDTDHLRKVS